jgi:hypothetical protein
LFFWFFLVIYFARTSQKFTHNALASHEIFVAVVVRRDLRVPPWGTMGTKKTQVHNEAFHCGVSLTVMTIQKSLHAEAVFIF